MARAFERYLKPGGKVAFLLTSSLIRSLNAGGFRQKILKYSFHSILDFTLYTSIHEGATCWAFIPIIENKEGKLGEKLDYHFFIPLSVGKHPEEKPNFKVLQWPLTKEELILNPKDPRSPWIVASPEVIKLFRKMQKHSRMGDVYQINRGIMTSANDIYFLKEIEASEDDLVTATTLLDRKVNLERDIVYPLITGKQIGSWTFENSYVLVPHKPPEWRPISEDIMQNKYKQSYSYLSSHKERLSKDRQDYSTDKGPFYMVFRISKRKTSSWKVAYADISTKLEACVIPTKIRDNQLGMKHTMIDHTAYFISVNNEEEAYYLAALLNSIPLRAFSYGFGRPKGGIPFRGFLQWTIGILPIPSYDSHNEKCKKVIEYSKKAHEYAKSGKSDNLLELEHQINNIVADLYGLSHNDMNILRQHYDLLSGKTEQA